MGRKEDRNKQKKPLEQADLKMSSASKECKQFLDMLILKIQCLATVIGIL